MMLLRSSESRYIGYEMFGKYLLNLLSSERMEELYWRIMPWANLEAIKDLDIAHGLLIFLIHSHLSCPNKRFIRNDFVTTFTVT